MARLVLASRMPEGDEARACQRQGRREQVRRAALGLSPGVPLGPDEGEGHGGRRLRRLVEGLPGPCYVTGQRRDVLAWDAAAADLPPDFGLRATGERNVLLFMLTESCRDRGTTVPFPIGMNCRDADVRPSTASAAQVSPW